MTEITCCKKCSVYTFLALNIFLSLIILLLLFLSTYDVIFLDWYQYIYLVLATIVWLLLFCTYVAKLVLIIIGKLPSKYLKLAWIVLNAPAFAFLLIGLIFDIVMYSKIEIAFIIYLIIYWLVSVLYIVFTLFDFFHIEYQIKLSENMANSEEKTVKDDNLQNVEVKTFQDRGESVNAKMKEN